MIEKRYFHGCQSFSDAQKIHDEGLRSVEHVRPESTLGLLSPRPERVYMTPDIEDAISFARHRERQDRGIDHASENGVVFAFDLDTRDSAVEPDEDDVGYVLAAAIRREFFDTGLCSYWVARNCRLLDQGGFVSRHVMYERPEIARDFVRHADAVIEPRTMGRFRAETDDVDGPCETLAAHVGKRLLQDGLVPEVRDLLIQFDAGVSVKGPILPLAGWLVPQNRRMKVGAADIREWFQDKPTTAPGV